MAGRWSCHLPGEIFSDTCFIIPLNIYGKKVNFADFILHL